MTQAAASANAVTASEADSLQAPAQAHGIDVENAMVVFFANALATTASITMPNKKLHEAANVAPAQFEGSPFLRMPARDGAGIYLVNHRQVWQINIDPTSRQPVYVIDMWGFGTAIDVEPRIAAMSFASIANGAEGIIMTLRRPSMAATGPKNPGGLRL